MNRPKRVLTGGSGEMKAAPFLGGDMLGVSCTQCCLFHEKNQPLFGSSKLKKMWSHGVRP